MNESVANKIDFTKLYKSKKNYTDYKNEIKQKEEIIIFKSILWHDPIKKIRDYGFYARFDETNNDNYMKSHGFSDVIITFQLNEKLEWVQLDNDTIYGFKNLDGKKLLDYLNNLSFSIYNKKGVCIRNKYNERIVSNFW